MPYINTSSKYAIHYYIIQVCHTLIHHPSMPYITISSKYAIHYYIIQVCHTLLYHPSMPYITTSSKYSFFGILCDTLFCHIKILYFIYVAILCTIALLDIMYATKNYTFTMLNRYLKIITFMTQLRLNRYCKVGISSMVMLPSN